MMIQCGECDEWYDDAKCDTGHPHDRFISDEDAAQKDLAIALLGKEVLFHHMPVSAAGFHVTSINFEGMVTLKELPGFFAPHIFRIKQ